MALKTQGFSGAIAANYIPALNAVQATDGTKILLLAHTVAEGFNPKTVAFKSNNPGNIGTDTTQNRIRNYPTLVDGVAAQINQKNLIMAGNSKYYKPTDSLLKYLTTYAPPPQNNPQNYLKIVVGVFAKQGYTVNANTTLLQISNLGNEKKKTSPQRTYNFFRNFILRNSFIASTYLKKK